MECGGSGWLSYCKAVSGALELGVGWKQHETWDNGVWGRAVDSSSDFWATRTFAVQCGFFLFFLSSLTSIFEPVLSQTGNFPKCSAKLD